MYPDFVTLKHFSYLRLSESAYDRSNCIWPQESVNSQREMNDLQGEGNLQECDSFSTLIGKQYEKSFSAYGPNEAV